MSINSTNIKRIYIGNLDETIDEYAIVKLFEKYGKITFIEVMVHWTGPKKGLPRGFCFLEYEKKEQALAAIHALHGKVIKGRPLVVSFAHMTPEEDEAKKRDRGLQKNRPNSLSILRGQRLQNSSTDAKIKAIERKLMLLKQDSDKNTGTTTSTNTSTASASNPRNNMSKRQENRFRPY